MIIVNQFMKMIGLKTTTTVILSEEIATVYKMIYGKFTEYQRRFLVTEDLSLLYGL